MPITSIGKTLRKVSEAKTRDEKIELLRKNDALTFRALLKMAFDPDLKWALPEGAPPYTPSKFHDNEGMIHKEFRRMYLFVEGGNPNLKPHRREQLYKELLECVTPEDAEFLIAVKDKTVPKVFKGVTQKLVEEAFPS